MVKFVKGVAEFRYIEWHTQKKSERKREREEEIKTEKSDQNIIENEMLDRKKIDGVDT